VTISGRSAKILVAALAVSAVLNLIAVGFAGSVIGGAVILRDLINQSRTPMPEELSLSFRQNIRAHRRDIVSALRDFRDARVEQQKAFRAETFDRAAAEAQQAKVRAAGEHLVIILQTALLDSIESLPDPVRRELSPVPFSVKPLQALDAPDGG
jgi:Heavy-metal resistance